MACIEKITIIGAGGRVGGAFATELLKSNKHKVTALTRKGSKSVLPPGLTVVEVDYNDHAELVSALQGQQFLIITLSVMTPSDTHTKIVKAAAEAGVPYIMPNIYGSDVQNPAILNETLNGKTYKERFADFDGLQDKITSWIVLVCGPWFEWSLALGEPFFGIDIAARTVTFYDDGNTVIETSTWEQCGRAVAQLLSLPEHSSSSDENPSPCVSDWKNKPLYIHSFKLSQRDILASLHRVLKTTDVDWMISYEPSDKRLARGLELLRGGDRMRGFATASYARTFFPNGDADFESKWGVSNELLGLPREDLDVVTRRVVGMVEGGWNPF